MFAGHFGLAAAVRSKKTGVPLWALMISTQLLDILFVPLVLMGIESIQPTGKGGYGEGIIHANYTHSLVGALLIALCAGLIAWRLWGRRGGLVIAAVVFSHWILDLLVHRADMPILPGNIGNLPLLGFGLWATPIVSIAMESALIIIGAVFYFRSAWSRANDNPKNLRQNRNMAIIATTVLTLLMVLALVTDVLGIGG